MRYSCAANKITDVRAGMDARSKSQCEPRGKQSLSHWSSVEGCSKRVTRPGASSRMLLKGQNPLDYVESTRVTKMAQELAARRNSTTPAALNPLVAITLKTVAAWLPTWGQEGVAAPSQMLPLLNFCPAVRLSASSVRCPCPTTAPHIHPTTSTARRPHPLLAVVHVDPPARKLHSAGNSRPSVPRWQEAGKCSPRCRVAPRDSQGVGQGP